MSVSTIRGSLPSILLNADQLYEGNLVHYFQAVFNHAKNLQHPYHNFRHMFHVTWLCHKACSFYVTTLSRRQMRNLLIAAMFHDIDHSGQVGPDALNIARALEALETHTLPEDRLYLADISALISATEYPYKVPSETLPLCAQIIRDADLSQALSVAWIQQVIFGLAAEWGKQPTEVLKGQNAFLSNLKFHTKWAQLLYPQASIDEKIAETRELVQLLESPSAQV